MPEDSLRLDERYAGVGEPGPKRHPEGMEVDHGPVGDGLDSGFLEIATEGVLVRHLVAREHEGIARLRTDSSNDRVQANPVMRGLKANEISSQAVTASG